MTTFFVMSKRADKREQTESQTKKPVSEKDGKGRGGFDRVPGPGPKDADQGAVGPEAKERLERNH